MPRLGQLHPARHSPPRPVAHDGGLERSLRPAEITPGMTVRPADLAHGLGEGAVLEDTAQEMNPAVAHEELAAELEPDLRLHAGGDYALVSILKCRLPPRSMKLRSGADGRIPSGRSARHGDGNPTVPRANTRSGGHRMRFMKAFAVAVAMSILVASGASAQEVTLSVA